MKKIFIISIIPFLAVFSKCNASSSSTTSGFDYSSTDLPTFVADSTMPAWSFSATGTGAVAFSSTRQCASVVYSYSTTKCKLGIALGEYSTSGKLKFRILLNFDDAWTTALPTAGTAGTPITNTHTLSNGTATLLVTTTEGQAPRFYTISIPTSSVDISYDYGNDIKSTSTLIFKVYTLTFPANITLDFSAKSGPSVTLLTTIVASGTSN